MSYDSEVLTDSPWGYWKTDETSGTTLADSSGNNNNLGTASGTQPPTLARTGPTGAADAIDWPVVPSTAVGDSSYAKSSAAIGTTTAVLTIEVWFKLDSLPSTSTAVGGVGYGVGNTSARPAYLFVEPDGTIKLWWGSSSTSGAVAASAAGAVSAGTWYHAVGVLTSTTGKIRLNKVDVASASHATSIDSSAQVFIHTGSTRSGLGELRTPGAVRTSKHALYLATLADARIDAHYNAMFPSGDATVSAVAATATASATAPAVTADATVTAPTATATAAATEPAVSGTGDATVNPPAATVTTEALPPTLAWDANLAAATATATADALTPTVTAHATIAAPAATATATAEPPDIDNGSGNHTVTAPVATATATAHAPVFTANYEVGTDTTNTFTGLDLTAHGTVTITYPAATPTVDLGTRVDAALPYPQPVMDDGRPT